MDKIFEGKVALVTGAASGIGRASATAFAQRGAKVVVADVAVEGGEATVRAINAAGGNAVFVKTDVTKAADLRGAVAVAVEEFGRLDLAHNNAGVLAATSLLADDAEAVFDRSIAANSRSVMLSMKYEIEQMLRQGQGGAIVNTASVLGLVGGFQQWAYAASKHAVVGLTKGVAIEFIGQGIRINAVCPGAVRTPMTQGMSVTPEIDQATAAMHPIGRFAQPEEIAGAVMWLCSDAASFVVGTAVPVDGGFVAV